MPAGTLTLTSNSIIVKGTGTAFNTELKSGDFIVSVVGGVTYTLPVKTVDNATQATLIKAYDTNAGGRSMVCRSARRDERHHRPTGR